MINRLETLYRRLLCKLLKLEMWHAVGRDRHLYRDDIIQELDRSDAKTIIEFGCGLGDIICRTSKVGVASDLSSRVLIAARFSYPWVWLSGRIKFRKLSLDSELDDIYDIIVAVNFIHHIRPTDLRSIFKRLYDKNLATGGVLIFDLVDNESYEVNHNLEFLTEDLRGEVTIRSGYEFGRQVVSFRKGEAD